MNYIQVPTGFLRFNLLIPNHGTSVDYKIRRLKNIYIKVKRSIMSLSNDFMIYGISCQIGHLHL
jgi:hypothetical protein